MRLGRRESLIAGLAATVAAITFTTLVARAKPGGATVSALSFAGNINPVPQAGSIMTFAFNNTDDGTSCVAPAGTPAFDPSGNFVAQVDLSGCTSFAFDGGNVTYQISIGGNAIGSPQPVTPVPYAKYADVAAVAADGGAIQSSIAQLQQSVSTLQGQVATIQGEVHAPSAFRAWLTVNQPVNADTYFTVAFNLVEYDLAGEYDNATGKFTAKQAGEYLVQCGLWQEAPAAAGVWTTQIVRTPAGASGVEENGVDVQNAVAGGLTSSVVATMQLTAGDVVQCQYFNPSSAPVLLQVGQRRNVFSASRLY
jgi:C1q domain-containing protein